MAFLLGIKKNFYKNHLGTGLLAAALIYFFSFIKNFGGVVALQDTVIKEISSHLKCEEDQISLDMQLQDLGIDSLKAITILYELEDRFDIEIPNEVLESLNVVNDIVIQLDKLIENKATE